MAQEQIQTQRLEQQQRLAQNISQLQLLQAQLTELPLAQLIERINAEMDDNPALEPSPEAPLDTLEPMDNSDHLENPDYKDSYEQEQRQSALDEALESIGRDDEELPVYQHGGTGQEEREDLVCGQTESFYDQLKEQMNMADLSERETFIMEYLIGSLDDDGLLRKPLSTLTISTARLLSYPSGDRTCAASVAAIRSCRHRSTVFAGMSASTGQAQGLLAAERFDDAHIRAVF